jgi:hypothetical protein
MQILRSLVHILISFRSLPTHALIHFFLIFLLIFIVGGGVQTGSTRHVGHLLAYCTCPRCLWGWRIWWNEWQGKPKYSEKTCPDATLSTTNPTWPDPGLNPGRRGGKPATNRFSYGAANTNPWLCGPLASTRRCSLISATFSCPPSHCGLLQNHSIHFPAISIRHPSLHLEDGGPIYLCNTDDLTQQLTSALA